MKKKYIFIFGVNGQDGSYLANFLLKKNYKIFGFVRSLKKSSLNNLEKLGIKKKIILKKYSNIKDISDLLVKENPVQIYCLAGDSSVSNSFLNPLQAYYSNIVFLFGLLELVRSKKLKASIFNAVSTECFGKNKNICDEKTNFDPLSPYARAKSFSFWLVKYYRENFNVRACNGILSNHNSPLRKKNFIIKKIANYVQNFDGKTKLKIGNIDISRDWGWAHDYVQAIYGINSLVVLDDYIIATGKITSLKEVVKKFFKIKNIGLQFVKFNNKEFLRPSEAKYTKYSIAKIKKDLDWKPKNNINLIIKKMHNEELF